MIVRYVQIIYLCLLTGISAAVITGCETASEAFDQPRAQIVQIDQNLTSDGFGETSYVYTSEEPSSVKLWLEILKDGKKVGLENNDELLLYQDHDTNVNAELGLNVHSDDHGNLVWQFQFGEQQKSFKTEDYSNDCVTRNYSVASTADVDSIEPIPIVKYACWYQQADVQADEASFEFKFLISK